MDEYRGVFRRGDHSTDIDVAWMVDMGSGQEVESVGVETAVSTVVESGTRDGTHSLCLDPVSPIPGVQAHGIVAISPFAIRCLIGYYG